MTSIDEIKARIDIVDLVSQTVQLRRSGKSYTGFCPFHANSRTPAFVIFPETGTWRCFGQCNEGGDIFRYVMKKEGWDFTEALHFLAEKAGVDLKPPTPAEQAAAEENDHLRLLLEEAASFYHHQLIKTPAGKPALDYLRQKRELNDETIEAFGLGYAPNSWDAALKHFKNKGHDQQTLIDTGLITERQREAEFQSEQITTSSHYDRFRNRLMIPIRDERGRMAGFGARILNPDDQPKFLNSPQTAVFDKGRLLYGLDRARKAIRAQDQAVIVEGYLDVIALHQAGFTNVVSPMGTALTEHQLGLLKRFTRRIVLALDSDAAGSQATMRGLQVARQAMDREYLPDYFAPGKLMALESHLQADLRITTLPEGIDPDEIVNRDPKAWGEIVEQARPIVIHVMETLAAGRDLSDPKVKSEIASQVLPLIQEVASPIERDTFRQRLARLLRVDERSLDITTPTARPRPAPGREKAAPPPATGAKEERAGAQDSAYALEAYCLGVLLRHPDLLYKVDRTFQEYSLGRLSTEDFQHAGHQDILRLLLESADQDLAEPQNFVMNSLSLDMMELSDGLLARTDQLDPSEDRVLDELIRTLLELRKQRLSQSIVYMSYLFQEAQDEGDLRALQYGQTMQQHIRVKKQLDHAYGKFNNTAAARR